MSVKHTKDGQISKMRSDKVADFTQRETRRTEARHAPNRKKAKARKVEKDKHVQKDGKLADIDEIILKKMENFFTFKYHTIYE